MPEYKNSDMLVIINEYIHHPRYREILRELAKAQTDASNAAQSAYLLSVMGKWVANPAATA